MSEVWAPLKVGRLCEINPLMLTAILVALTTHEAAVLWITCQQNPRTRRRFRGPWPIAVTVVIIKPTVQPP